LETTIFTKESLSMLRALFAGATAFALLMCANFSSQAAGDKPILDKKDKLTDKDPTYKNSDPKVGVVVGNPCKTYTLSFKKGDKVVIRLKSKDFDSVVLVEDNKGKFLDGNDDDPDDPKKGYDSKLVWTAPNDGDYRIVATCLIHPGSMTKYGDFQLTVEKAK
jgi:hypothetical protein